MFGLILQKSYEKQIRRNCMQSSTMASRLLMLSFDYIRPKDPTVSLATASILTYLKQKLPTIKPNIQVFHQRFNVANDSIDKVTQEVILSANHYKPNVIASGVYVWNESYVSHAFSQLCLQSEPKPIVVFGGPQITYSCKNSLERLYPNANAFIRGYAEQSLLQLLVAINENRNQIPSIDIKGVHYSGAEDRGLMSDMILETIDSPLLSGQTQHSGYIRWETKRGCVFKCAFCQHRDIIGSTDTTTVERIKGEVQWIVDQNITEISIVDPIFNIKNSHYMQVLDHMIEYGFRGRLNLQTRLEMIDEKYIRFCRQLLDRNVSIELECGVQTLIDEEMKIIDRHQSRTRILNKSQQLVENQIPFEVSLIYGLPLQTVDTFEKNIEFVSEKMRPNRVRAWPLMLLKGTKMFKMKGKYGLREKLLGPDLQPMDDMRQYNGIPHVISSSTFNESQWLQMKQLAEVLNSKDNFK